MLTTLPAPVSGDSKKVHLLLDTADTALELHRTYNQRYAFTINIVAGRLIIVIGIVIVHRVPVSSPVYC